MYFVDHAVVQIMMRQTSRQTKRQIEEKTDRHINSQTDRGTADTEKQIDRLTEEQ